MASNSCICLKNLVLLFLFCSLLTYPKAQSQILDRGYGFDLEVDVIDPHNTSYDDMFDLAAHHLETLLILGPESSVEPGLAERWEHNSESRTLTLHLRKGLRWSDGVALTAHTVKKSLERALSDKSLSTEKTLLNYLLDNNRRSSDVASSQSLSSASSWQDKISLPNVVLVDDHTVLLKNFPTSTIGLYSLTHVLSAPLPLHQTDGKGNFPNHIAMSSSGPYQLKESDSNKEIKFEINPHYYGQKPYFAFVNFYFAKYKELAGRYFSFKLDILEGLDLKQVAWLKNYYAQDLILVPNAWSDFLVLKEVGPSKKTKSIRQAMISVIDHKILNRLLKSNTEENIGSLIPWSSAKFPGKSLAKDHSMALEQAKDVLLTAGYSKSNHFKICIGQPEFRDSPKIDSYLKSRWEAIFIDVEFVRFTDEDYQSGLKNDAEKSKCIGAILSYSSRFRSEEEILNSFFNGVFAEYAISHRKSVDLWKKVQSTNQQDLRLELLAELEQSILESYHAVRIASQSEYVMVKPYIRGYERARGNGSLGLSQYLSNTE